MNEKDIKSKTEDMVKKGVDKGQQIVNDMKNKVNEGLENLGKKAEKAGEKVSEKIKGYSAPPSDR